MGDVKLFSIEAGHASEISGTAVVLERSLQTLIERNLETFLGIRFLASEHSTGPKHGGRIDSLGVDENGSPVIIEYKRSTNENVINQGLFYLDWLMDHRAEFKLLVLDRLGKEHAEDIDWSHPRLLCIAGGLTRYDEHAVQQMGRNIELIRHRRFGDGLLLLELVNAASADDTVPPAMSTAPAAERTVTDTLASLQGPLRDLYEELRAFLLALGDDVQEKPLKFYVAFKRIKNFACVEVKPGLNCLNAFVKVDPNTIVLESGFTRDVSKIGHYGTGELEIFLKTRDDFERAKSLFQASYEVS